MIIGIDAHKHVHQAVAIDAAGREQGRWRGANTPAGWDELHCWAQGLGPERRWGIEGAGQYGRGLAQHLVAADELVAEVNPRQTAAMRRGGRRRGKTDRLDALAVARVVAQEGDDLPTVQAEDDCAVLAVLTAEREAVRAEATRLRNQLHQVLPQLGFVDDRSWPDLTDPDAAATLETYAAPTADAVVVARAAVVRRLAVRLGQALRQTAAIAAEIIEAAAPRSSPLQETVGVGALTAGMLAAHLGCGSRFTTDAQVAMYAGTAPLDASSGAQERHRLNRTGNRALNALIHRIALVQLRCHAPAQASVARRRKEGKTQREALRALKRYLTRAIFRAWQRCLATPAPTP